MKAAHTSAKDPTLLTDWFQKDENALPSTYILKPITSVFPFYNDESSENEDKRKKVSFTVQSNYELHNIQESIFSMSNFMIVLIK